MKKKVQNKTFSKHHMIRHVNGIKHTTNKLSLEIEGEIIKADIDSEDFLRFNTKHK